uniref:HMA domain-containing protein n=2 Tax=Populus trichocarpa TaxID=3694 RepID=A0A3N7FB17_POPTR|eukprot:XP_024448695.1 heavy metal-associated isoprenylated plant protein 12 isoform X1 [Populus trichocarpa]
MWQKLVLKVDVQDQKTMTRINKTAVSLSGVDSISIDRKANKLTVMVIGDGIDAVDFVTELRTFCHAEIMSVGPARNEKKIEPKKEEQKEQEGQMSKDEDQVKKDENAFAELNKSNQANIDPYLGVTVAEES